MGNLNKIVSLVIGLITVVVFFAVLTGRINLGTKLSRTNKSIAPTLTPTPKKALTSPKTPTPTLAYKVNRYQAQGASSPANINNIPATGLPLPLIPAIFATLLAGVYFKGKK